MGKGGLLWGSGSLTEAQVVALSLVAVVLLVLLTLNVGVYRLYKRETAPARQRHAKTKAKKMSDVWVYQMHRENPQPAVRPELEMIRKLQASHENLTTAMSLEGEGDAGRGQAVRMTQQQEEVRQVLEELDITTDLFLHDTSRRSSISDRASVQSDVSNVLGGSDELSLSSVCMADFHSDDHDDDSRDDASHSRPAAHSSWSKVPQHARSRARSVPQHLLLAEFHNDAFDFAEATAVVETINDVQL